MSRFFRSTKTSNAEAMARIPVTEHSDEEYQKKVVVKKDLAKIKWRHIKPKRGYRNGIYPNWSRLRNKVYKNAKVPFQNNLRTSVDRIRVSVSSDPVHPVHLTRTKSSSTLSIPTVTVLVVSSSLVILTVSPTL